MFSSKSSFERPKIIKTHRNKYLTGRIRQGEALIYLHTIKEKSAGIVFLDPPFNLGKQYSKEDPSIDRRPESEYEEWLKNILDVSFRILQPGGALYLYHLPVWAMRFGAYIEKKLEFRHWIAVAMKNRFVRGSWLYPAHYALLYFTKGKPTHFTRPKIVPQSCRHCGKLIKDYGGYKEIIEEKGINLSDFWEDLSPVRHKNRKYRKANELPFTLFKRIIGISGDNGMLYVDPFAGSGSGIVAAAEAGLAFDGCDIMESNCSVICERLDSLHANLRKRRKR